MGVSADRKRHLENLDRRRRQPGIGGARGALRLADDARHHRRRSQAFRALCRSLQACVHGVQAVGEADRCSFAGLCRRDRRAGARGAVAGLQDYARPHRQGAGMAADGAGRVRQRGRSRFALCRLAGNRGAQDRGDREGARRRAFPAQIQRRPAAACQADAQHRALWHQGGAAGAGAAGVGRKVNGHPLRP